MITETVSSLATLVGGRIVGDGTRRIRGVADLRTAGPETIGFVRDQKYRDAARSSKAGVKPAQPSDGRSVRFELDASSCMKSEAISPQQARPAG